MKLCFIKLLLFSWNNFNKNLNISFNIQVLNTNDIIEDLIHAGLKDISKYRENYVASVSMGQIFFIVRFQDFKFNLNLEFIYYFY